MPFDFKKFDEKCAGMTAEQLQREWQHYTRQISGSATSTAVSGLALPLTAGISVIGIGMAAPAIHNARRKREIIERHLQRLGTTHETRARDVLGSMAFSGTIGIVTLGVGSAGADAIAAQGAEHGISAIVNNDTAIKVGLHAALDGGAMVAEHAHHEHIKAKDEEKAILAQMAQQQQGYPIPEKQPMQQVYGSEPVYEQVAIPGTHATNGPQPVAVSRDIKYPAPMAPPTPMYTPGPPPYMPQQVQTPSVQTPQPYFSPPASAPTPAPQYTPVQTPHSFSPAPSIASTAYPTPPMSPPSQMPYEHRHSYPFPAPTPTADAHQPQPAAQNLPPFQQYVHAPGFNPISYAHPAPGVAAHDRRFSMYATPPSQQYAPIQVPTPVPAPSPAPYQAVASVPVQTPTPASAPTPAPQTAATPAPNPVSPKMVHNHPNAASAPQQPYFPPPPTHRDSVSHQTSRLSISQPAPVALTPQPQHHYQQAWNAQTPAPSHAPTPAPAYHQAQPEQRQQSYPSAAPIPAPAYQTQYGYTSPPE